MASVLTLGISSIGIAGVAKADVTSVNGGSENVDNSNGLVQSETQDNNSGISLQSISQGNESGGFWIRGIRSKTVVSDYKHYKKQGKGMAINGDGKRGNGGWKKAGTFSNGRVAKTGSGNNSYYDHK
ncbi:hypothetical protein [Mammaliicoccus vitulinus]|uniref:hypothetical protein n=1 Tax=Mammaliicoccus vitulinus TaxID=71237 RepID=UPI001FBA9032|nr:hypothetical protein [Mammaliicoccus vitulinus]